VREERDMIDADAECHGYSSRDRQVS
jgi:hypothetical protein